MHWSTDAIACVIFGLTALVGRRRFAKVAYDTIGCLVRSCSASMYERIYLLVGLVFTLVGIMGLLGAIRFNN